MNSTNIFKAGLRLVAAGLLLCQMPLRAVDFPVTTAQQLQDALTAAAANGADDTLYITNGYYVGNFNFNSTEARNLTLVGATNTQVTIDGSGNGRSMNLSCTNAVNISVRGITFLRDCGVTTSAGLRVSAGAGTEVLVEDCRFLSKTNTVGLGLELVSGQNAIVRRCTVTGTSDGGGRGISISGFNGNLTVYGCNITTNIQSGLYISGGGVVVVTNNYFSGNAGGFQGNGAGAGIVNGAAITFANNTVIGNVGSSAGVHLAGTGTVLVSANTFSGNSGANAGALACGGSIVAISDNTFSDNAKANTGYPGGGAVGCYGGTFTLVNNTFTGNSAAGSAGGAVVSWYAATNTIINNTFTGNSALNGGGVLSYGTTSLLLSNNTFTANSASGSGGGLYCSGPATLSGNTFKQNTATLDGGAIYADGDVLRLINNLIVKNQQTSSGSKGGGVWVRTTATLDMINNTIFNNTAQGSGVGADVHLVGTGSSKKFYFNDAHDMSGTWDSSGNVVDVDPQFFDSVNGDYHLRGTSPLVNTGTNGAPSLPATDLDGEPRIGNGTVDIGCYEFTTTSTHPADADTNFVMTASEFNAYAAAWKSGQTWSNAPVVIPANYLTRAGYLMTNGGTYHNDGSARPVNWKIGP